MNTSTVTLTSVSEYCAPHYHTLTPALATSYRGGNGVPKQTEVPQSALMNPRWTLCVPRPGVCTLATSLNSGNT